MEPVAGARCWRDGEVLWRDTMNETTLPASLNLMTLGLVLLVLIVAFVYYMRKPSHRNSMEGTPERGEPGAPNKPRGTPLNADEAKRG